jgi:hypothetical protein
VKKTLLVIAALLGITFIGQSLTLNTTKVVPVSVSPTPSVTKNVQGAENSVTSTPTVTLTPTNTPTPTPQPTIQIYYQPSPTPTSGLSNDNSYTNVDGNQVHSPAYSNTVPAGATAICRDGAYSFSQHRSGTCSGHGGVAQWL